MPCYLNCDSLGYSAHQITIFQTLAAKQKVQFIEDVWDNSRLYVYDNIRVMGTISIYSVL